MRLLAQKQLAFLQAFADQPQLSVLQVTQAAVDNARGPAGGARGEIILLEKQRAPSVSRTLPCNRHPADAATDHDDIKVVSI